MILKDQVGNFLTKLTEEPPSDRELRRAVASQKPITRLFKDDGIVPNHPRWPLVIYRRAVKLRGHDPAALIDALFGMNNWDKSWRDGIYDFVHYHSQVHEVLGVARGEGRVEFGGVKGRILALKAGDVAILPAGTGHRLIESSRNFLVVGAYPPEGSYDECTDTRDRGSAIKSIKLVRRPKSDPVYGKSGPLLSLWPSPAQRKGRGSKTR
ncbi:cupin [Afipia carboxidovorans]|uniref:cupin n=1 Tax=Afipia carboxidovorans TaxID=40137 RepID=UPI003092924D|nr:cupin domain-containing protein [Afipia carboxidovorans]